MVYDMLCNIKMFLPKKLLLYFLSKTTVDDNFLKYYFLYGIACSAFKSRYDYALHFLEFPLVCYCYVVRYLAICCSTFCHHISTWFLLLFFSFFSATFISPTPYIVVADVDDRVTADCIRPGRHWMHRLAMILNYFACQPYMHTYKYIVYHSFYRIRQNLCAPFNSQ